MFFQRSFWKKYAKLYALKIEYSHLYKYSTINLDSNIFYLNKYNYYICIWQIVYFVLKAWQSSF